MMLLHDELKITDFDLHRPCAYCGSAECDPDEMDVWVTHLATWHGYKVTDDKPGDAKGDRPRVIKHRQAEPGSAAAERPRSRLPPIGAADGPARAGRHSSRAGSR
jgi:hypothetical protein